MFKFILIISAVILSVSTLANLYRLKKGPSVPDRVITLDTIGINLISIVAIVSVIVNTQAFLEVILLIGALAFIGTVAFSKFIEKGVIIEHDRSSDK